MKLFLDLFEMTVLVHHCIVYMYVCNCIVFHSVL